MKDENQKNEQIFFTVRLFSIVCVFRLRRPSKSGFRTPTLFDTYDIIIVI